MEPEVKIKAVLFDLDNTLILFDEIEFYELYVYKLSQHFKDIMSTSEFARRLMASTRLMSNNDGKLINAEYFINDFYNGIKIKKNDLWQRFADFYSNEFEQFKNLMQPIPGVRELILKIQEKGLKIVIASNPMLPENVQQLRLNWAGLEGIDFDLITHVDNSKFCKPNVKYYYEICEKIKVKPQNCIMVGNDTLNDMIAAKTGMKTYFVVDSQNNTVEVSRELVGLNKVEMQKPDYKGRLLGLIPILENMNKN